MKLDTILEADATIEQATQEAYRFFSNSGRGGTDAPEKDGKGMTFAVRDLGSWEVSDDDRFDPDNEGEDFSDWDYQKPTADTSKWIKDKLNEFRTKYPKFKFSASVEEKCWIHFYVEPK
jgi:hypothetical protein